MPRGYAVFAGPPRAVCLKSLSCAPADPWTEYIFSQQTGRAGRSDVTTLQEIVETMAARSGKSNRIWVMDRGMISEENRDFLNAGERRSIVGTPKSMLKQFEQQLLGEDRHAIREGLEVKLCPSPDGDKETFSF